MKRRFIIKNLFFWQDFLLAIISNILPAMRYDFPDSGTLYTARLLLSEWQSPSG